MSGAASWDGNRVRDRERFRAYLKNVVGPRVRDEEGVGVREALAGLATTGMETAFLEEVLRSDPPIEPWEVGEALAECLLRDDEGDEVIWPWNHVRDRRTPRASLPGADLVGFARSRGGAVLLFGEVKTSSDRNSPPGVMHGKRGMAWQLEAERTRLDIQRALLAWLYWRCDTPEMNATYREAVTRYLQSEGTCLHMVGVLLRDTEPDERDISSRAAYLGGTCAGQTKVRVTAWYMPLPIDDWAAELAEEAA